MTTGAAHPIPERRPYLAIARAHARALWSRRPLPPGDLIPLDRLERNNRMLLLERAAMHGPIFKAHSAHELVICVVGLSIGRRLLREHAASLRPMTLQLESLFPKGFLRQMEGDAHREVRRNLVRGLNAMHLDAVVDDLSAVAEQGLESYRRRVEQGHDLARGLTEALARIASGMLVRVFFGARPGSPSFDRLMHGYQQLGPHGLVWNLTSKQEIAFARLRDELRSEAAQQARRPDPAFASGLLGRLLCDTDVDDTLLGNLIYMVEMGRDDLRGLLRWIAKYAGDHPGWAERVAAEPHPAPSTPSLAEAFVLETLRLDQSERLLRRVTGDIVFDGYLIPRGSVVRVCMWEAHKAADAFPRPFDFDPCRFLGTGPTVDQFSPFGLDHHHCPFSTTSVTLGSVFLRTLAGGYHLETHGGGRAVRGAYHWEPPPGCAVGLRRRHP
jgi:cytochrome P450